MQQRDPSTASNVPGRAAAAPHGRAATELVESFFRHEYGRLVATLSRRAGVQHIEAIEDAAQHALVRALESWPLTGLPDNPPAWLFRVAQNEWLGTLRRHTRRRHILEQHGADGLGAHRDGADGASAAQRMPAPYLSSEVQDDLLRMLFVCCDPAIAPEAQLVLALKTLCGFDVREIALRLFASEASIYKRLSRARQRLRTAAPSMDELSQDQYAERLPAVHKILYLLFTEGYLSYRAERAIVRELCHEAIRLATLLAEHPIGQVPESYALLALMHLHTARLNARQDGAGGLLLLQEQDRALFDQQQIQLGLSWLARSAQGDVLSRYHAEAGIAAEHALAPTFQQTRWARVAACYAQLEQIAPSALHRLNRAIAVAESQGPTAGLAIVEGFEPPSWLAGSYQWAAVMADLHHRCGHQDQAKRYRQIALQSAPTQAVKELLQRRLKLP